MLVMRPSELEYLPWLAAAYALSIYALLLALANFQLRFSIFSGSLTKTSGRYGAIDGLRGLLATGVFVHHSFTAYGYFATGSWQWSTNPLLNQLGQTTVAMFFMITGFLFTLKTSKPRINWTALYKSRLARLMPLYGILVLVVFGLVLFLSGGELKESPGELATEFFQWLTFVCFGRPDINAFPMTWTIVAGVNWSLAYEVFFYITCIPLIHIAAKYLSNQSLLLVYTVLLLALLAHRSFNSTGGPSLSLYAAHFLCGIVTAYAYNTPAIRLAIGRRTFKLIAIAAFCTLLLATHSYGSWAVLSTMIIFASFVGGTSLFGLLNTRAAIWLGDISYGIYLLHGILLWLTLSLVITPARLIQLDLPAYWLLVFAIGACVLMLAGLSYAKLERPIMLWVASKER
jgi:peptidoglycan/LPS O-acetylase OafA/YrhL